MFSHIQQPASTPNGMGSSAIARATLVLTLMAAAGSAGATSYLVTNLDDSGAGSLRDAISKANSHRGADSVTFRDSGIVTLASTLPAITDSAGLIIDGGRNDVTISGNNTVQVMVVNVGGKLELKNLTVADGWFNPPIATDEFGGIGNSGILTIRNSTISHHYGGLGAGGIKSTGYLSIYDSTLSSNSSGGTVGGIFNEGTLMISGSTLSGNSAFGAGGIDNRGSLVISSSTVIGNNAAQGVGGIRNRGKLTVGSTTISDNSARVSNGGIGGLINETSGTAKVSNSTFTRNRPSAFVNSGILTVINSSVFDNQGNSFLGSPLGGINNSGTLNIANSILAKNSLGDCATTGVLNASGVNWVMDGSCGFRAAGDPLLGPLADNGGPTQTLALLPGSGAIDAANDAICRTSSVNNLDQRGIKRPQGWHCDIGAFEKGAHDFPGFSSPVGNPPELNEMKAGQAVPMTFRLNGNQRAAAFKPPYPVSKQIDCSTDQLIDGTVVPSHGNLRVARNQYTYFWNTDTAWAGTCRQFQVLFADGSFGQANFSFEQ